MSGREMLRSHFQSYKTVGFRESNGKFHRLNSQQIRDLNDLYYKGYSFDNDGTYHLLRTDDEGTYHENGRVKVVWTQIKEPTFYILFRNHRPKLVETKTVDGDVWYSTWHAVQPLS